MIRETIKKEVTNIMKRTQEYQLGYLQEDEYERKIQNCAKRINKANAKYEQKVAK